MKFAPNLRVTINFEGVYRLILLFLPVCLIVMRTPFLLSLLFAVFWHFAVLAQPVNDNVATNEDTPFNFSVTANDTDVNAATVDLDVSAPGRQSMIGLTDGSFSVDNSGNVTFTPTPDFFGIVTLDYGVEDNLGNPAGVATITVTVNSINDPPVANDDVLNTPINGIVNIPITDNDSDIDGTLVLSTIDLDPTLIGNQPIRITLQGTWTVAGGVVTFVPLLNITGVASTTYTIEDNNGAESNSATITVIVNATPIANADATSTNENVPVNLNLLANDSDDNGLNSATVDLDPGTGGFQTSISPVGGNVSVDGSGIITYTPSPGFSGIVTFSYTVNDTHGVTSNEATVTITVNAVNTAPVANADATSTDEDTPVTLNIVSNDADADGTINPATVDLQPGVAGIQNSLLHAGGTITVNAFGEITYTPLLNFNGPVIFNYTVNDNEGATSNAATVTITVNAVNDPPVAVADVAITSEDTPVSFSVVANDTDIDGSINAGSVDLDPGSAGIQSTLVLDDGTFSVNGSGQVTFTPAPNFQGPISITYTVSDNEGAVSAPAQISITVNSINDAPIANADVATTSEDTPVTFSLVSNDSDPDGSIDASSVDLDPAAAGVQTSLSPVGGSVVVNAMGEVTFTPTANYHGPVNFSYTVADNLGLRSNAATVTITVTAADDPPVATNDAVSTNEDVPANFNILSNDSDPDGSIVSSTVDLDPSTAGQQTTLSLEAGNLSVNPGGVLAFTPTPNYNGQFSIQYSVQDNSGLTSNVATVTITVNSVNDAPVANPDVASTNEDTPVTFSIVSNDTDVDGSIDGSTVDLNPTLAGQQTSITPTGGTVTVDASGMVTVTPNSNYDGQITFNYRVADNEGLYSNTATVTVTVDATNDPPVANADAASTNEDTPVNINILANDSDPDGSIDAGSVDLDPGTAGQQTTRTLPSGTLAVSPAGVVTFTPNPNFDEGPVTFNYTVADNEGLRSNEATVTITINPINDPPVANADAAATTEDTPVTLNIVSNDTDIDGTINAASVDLNPSTGGRQTSINVEGGTIAVNASGVITYTPTANFNGTVTFQYTVEDNNGLVSNAATVTITVNAVDDPPVANADAVTTNEDVPVTLNILSNDTDSDGAIVPTTVDLDPGTAGQQLSLSLPGGSITVNTSGVISYTPTPNFNGAVVFSYTVQDNDGLTSNAATVTITVTSINDAPVAVNDGATTNEDVPVTINLLANDSDVDGTLNAASLDIDLTVPGVQSTRTTPNGTYSVSGGVLTFTPAANFNGSAVIQYTVADNQGAVSNQASITITVLAINDAPVAVNDAASTNQNNAVSINILANDTDDGSLNTASVDLDPGTAGVQNSRTLTEGTFTVNSSGSVTFSPVTNYFGTVSITYTVADNDGLRSNEATITVTVIHINQKPVANPDAVTTPEDTPVTILVVANDTDDVSIDPATVDLNTTSGGIQSTRTTPQGTFTVDATGSVLFTPDANYNGTVSIQYTVRDNEGATSDPATITITVTPVNDKPVAVNDSRTINEDNSAIINVIGNDTDADGSIVPNSVDLNPATPGIQTGLTVAEGTFTVDASGVVTFVPVSNFFGTVVINYTVTDNDGAVSDPATITVVVNPVNDPPVANNDVASTPQGQSITLNLLTNDLDVDGTIDASTVDLNPATGVIDKTRTIASGTYTVDNSGVLTFTPVPAFSGTSTITYNVADNLGAKSNNATISILVNFVNQPPVANDDAVTTTEDNPIAINVLANDTDDGTIVTATVDLNPNVGGIQNSITGPEGTFTVNGSGLVTFTPALNFHGTALVSYTVNDNIGVTSNVATLTVTVTPVNDPPVANNDAANTTEDTPVTINVIANDTDVDGTIDPASVDLVPGGDIDGTLTTAQGTFTRNATTGAVTFAPVANFFGNATATYSVRDNLGAQSNTATITVTVANVNDPPVFNVISDQRVLRNAAATAIPITGISPGPNETEPVLLSATSANTTLVPHPTITYAGTGPTATLSFKPQLNQSGVVEITVKAVDAGLNEFTRTFKIEVVNVVITSTPPTIALIGEPYAYNITVTPVPDELSLVATQKPSWLTITSTEDNAATLGGTPPSNATPSNITIQLRNGASVVDEQTYVLNINRRPTSGNFSVETNEDVSVVLSADNFALAYSDPDGHPLNTVYFTELPGHGTLYLGTTPVGLNQDITVSELESLVYTPLPDYNGPDTTYFRVRDAFSSSGADSYINFTITPVNDAPRITFLESNPLVHDIGREVAQIFTPNFQAEDPEGDDIVSAEIGFQRPNYDLNHDLLTFNNTAKIKGVYDDTQGILTLTGVASVQEYVDAIRSITYTFINLEDIVDAPRTVYVKLSDANGTSEIAERQINLTFDFVQLFVPHVFTPDGNGMNDIWPFPDDSGLEPYNDAIIRIFDQRGKLVFETIGFATPWDGKKDGVNVPIGTYFYVIDLRYGKIVYKGTVTILREEP